jgi:hypothetical protein
MPQATLNPILPWPAYDSHENQTFILLNRNLHLTQRCRQAKAPSADQMKEWQGLFIEPHTAVVIILLPEMCVHQVQSRAACKGRQIDGYAAARIKTLPCKDSTRQDGNRPA